jgi:hypothetical protein
MRRMLGALVACLALWPGSARAERVPQVHALVGVRIVVAPGQIIESGTVVLRDGLIEAVGADLKPPADARIWQLDKMTVYPGLIEPYRPLEWPEEKADSGAFHPNKLIRPERDATQIAWQEAELAKLREAGFTTALIAPKSGILRGQSVLINLGGGRLDDNLLRRNVFQHAALDQSGGRGSGYPGSLMGSVALLRQTLSDARWQAEAKSAAPKATAQRRPAVSPSLEAIEAVAQGKAKIVLQSQDVLDDLRLAAIAKELGLDAILVGAGDEYKRLADVQATKLPLILPIAFPKAPQVGKEDDLSVDMAVLRHWDAAPSNPKQLYDAGSRFALTSYELSEPKKLHEMAGQAIERGLKPEEALAALTTIPAAMLGIADRAGTIEVGKMANLVVTEGDLFTKDTKIRALFVDGRRFEIKESKAATIEPAGTWTLTVQVGSQTMPVTIELAGKVDELSGTVATMGGSLPIEDIEVSGNTLEISFDSSKIGMPGTITFTLEIDGDQASGTGTSPRGNFTISGERTSKPPAEAIR